MLRSRQNTHIASLACGVGAIKIVNKKFNWKPLKFVSSPPPLKILNQKQKSGGIVKIGAILKEL